MQQQQQLKETRYDRQLRLWHAHGQAALERAHVCVVMGRGAAACGAEVLKNLVLPGIGAFTIVDAAPVTEVDLGNNFFVAEDHVGRPRARCVAELLGQLNDDVAGHYVDEDVAQLVAKNPGFFHEFALVIVAGYVPLATVLAIDAECWPRHIPLVHVRCTGFVATMLPVLRAHHVVEAHPDNPPTDQLRLAAPWPEYSTWIDAVFPDLDQLDRRAMAHVPFPVLVIRCWAKFRELHPTAPNSDFRKFIEAEQDRHTRRLAATVSNGNDDAIVAGQEALLELDNWTEAARHARHAYSPAIVPSNVTALFDHEYLTTSDPAMSTAPHATPPATGAWSWPPVFWALVAALKSFVADHGCLPVHGAIPDMKASTEHYVQLQHIYRDKAERDAADLKARIQPVAVPAHGKRVSLDPAAIDDATVRMFCRNAAHLHVVATPSLADMVHRPAPWVRVLTNESIEDADAYAVHLSTCAMDAFYATHRRWAGEHPADADTDLAEFRSAARDIVRAIQAEGGMASVVLPPSDAPTAVPNGGAATPVHSPSINLDDWAREFVRAGPTELHPVAAYVGGVVAQECIKILTTQYVPCAGVYVYDGVHSTSTVLPW